MKARPILFQGDMIRAILDGRKTQTRRVIKDEPVLSMAEIADKHCRFRCPYGQPGDFLIPATYIPSLNKNYCADMQGNIWSRAKSGWKKLKGSQTSKGYLSVTPAHEGKYKTRLVHRLVCEAYYGQQPSGLPQVRHLDGNCLNNAPENLDWGTQEQNWADRALHGKALKEKHHASKLTEKSIKEIRFSLLSQRELAHNYGVAQSQIWCIKNNVTWRKDYKKEPPNMPRWASRITLEITDIRVERLQDISEDDAKTEGMWSSDSGFWHSTLHPVKGTYQCWPDPATAFQKLWSRINGEQSWVQNPWVWVIKFTPHLINVNDYMETNDDK